MASTEPGKLAFVDVTRGIAILMVIAAHLGQPIFSGGWARLVTEYGQMGVQLFFVASAYTLARSANERSKQERRLWRNFAIRRIFRIAPLYYLGILLYGGIALARSHTPSPGFMPLENYSLPNIVLNATFTHSLSPEAYNSVVPGGWSIGTEMLFYAALPILFGVWKGFERKPWGIVAVATGIAATNAITQASPLFWKIENNGFAYCNLLVQLPIFMVGGYAYFSKAWPRWASASGFCLLTIVSFAMFIQGGAIVLAVLPLAAGLSFMCLLKLLEASIQRLGILGRIGRVSYSMYLLHFLFVWFPVRKAMPYWPGDALTFYPVAFVAATGATFMCAWVAKKLIEDLGIALGKRVINMLTEPDRPLAKTA